MRGAREDEAPVNVTGQRALPEGTMWWEKAREAFAGMSAVGDIENVAESMFRIQVLPPLLVLILILKKFYAFSE